MSDVLYTIGRIPSAQSRAVTDSQTLTWPALAELLTAHEPREEKDGPAWLPGVVVSGPRRTEYATPWTLLPLDIEQKKNGSAPPTLQDVADAAALWGLQCALATSHSHTPGSPRYRLVFALSRALQHSEVKPLAREVATLLGCTRCLDESAMDPARIFYLPSCPPDRISQAESRIIEGAPLNVDECLRSASTVALGDSIDPRKKQSTECECTEAEPLSLTRDQLIEAAGRITLESCRAVLERLDASEGECWRDCVLLPLRNTAFWQPNRADDLQEAFEIASAQLPGDTTNNAAQWQARTKPTGRNPRTIGTFINACGGKVSTADGFVDAPNAPIDRSSCDAFFYFAPTGLFIDRTTREQWPAKSVDASVKWATRKVRSEDGTEKEARTQPSKWIEKHRPVHQISWLPGAGEVADGVVIMEAGEVPSPGNLVFNLYRPPAVIDGNARQASKWLDHLHMIYPDDADHLCKWMAYHVQQPAGKCNHALVLIGSPGIGKDTMLEPLVHGVGPWNFADIKPGQLVARFNGYRRNKVIRVNEAHDTGDEITRHGMYEAAKVLIAAPPEVLMVDEKHRKEYAIPNKCGVIFTSNHPTDAIYLPSDDRRHYVAASKANKEMFTGDYWADLWDWYGAGGLGHAVAYLQGVELATFNPKAPPPLTPAFWALVSSGEAPEDGDLRDLIAAVGSPIVLTLDDLIEKADCRMLEELRSPAKRRQWQHRLGRAGYLPVRNPGTSDGRWKIDGKNRAVYGQQSGTYAQHCEAIGAISEKVREVRDSRHQIF